ncbi:cysteine desulfurase-like protein, SufS subfamily [Candidatus Nitrososphaera evergladensis SR1]|uniref:cysteine desulfurase n=2 Tax=Nitrososphaera TaxID=497726 RepID=A0A075MU50_9ARCH|nr:cysteine desulfurase [Candidatus Nitrososphaera evergladensis]AIF84695.1 cysteine desulfurase-like protein, SufS subfamily [Candidatus Nitrososphaera evergladensis SR1]
MMQKGALNVEKIRKDFPILKRKVMGGKPLVYLDNAATTQKPLAVIDAIHDYYMNYNSNIHRAVHQLAEEATKAYEDTRVKIAKFINARSTDEIIFTRNTTEAINLVAYSWGRANIKKDDRIVITEIEHHSNIVPWQILTQEKGAKLEYIGVGDDGYLKMHEYKKYLDSGKVKLVSVSHMSNVLGTITPINDIINMAHEKGIPVLVDGAQSVPHMPVDVQKLDCEFMAFSAHKMLGPTGVGVLYVKRELLEKMPPFMGGGDMIKEVHKYETRYNDLPYKFEGGTPNIADVIGFAAAIDYLQKIGMDRVREHEIDITKYALDRVAQVKGVTIYGPMNAIDRGGVVSFNIGDIHPHDLATIMNDHGVAIRSGHHCAQVLMERLDVAATSRASFYIYNTKEEVDVFIDALSEARRLFKI